MKEFIQKKLKTGKIVLVTGVALLVAHIAFSVSFYSGSHDLFGPVMITLVALLVVYIVYVTKFYPYVVNERWLKKMGKQDVTEDIPFYVPNLPKSELYCGRRAFATKKPYAVIPYEEIAWVYFQENRFYGITMSKSVNFCLRDGTEFSRVLDTEEFMWLLNNMIAPCSPELLVGYGPEQKLKYNSLRAEYKKNKRNRK